MTGHVIDIKTKQPVNVDAVAPTKFPALYQSVTESEAGWGTRFDGYLIALDVDAFNTRARTIREAGSYAEFSCADGPPIACYVTPEMYQTLLEKKAVWLHVKPRDRSWLVE